MKKKSLTIAFLTLLGLGLGYLMFGKLGGQYVNLQTLFNFGGNAFESAFRSLSGIEEMRNKILLCGLAGGIIGAGVAFRLKG